MESEARSLHVTGRHPEGPRFHQWAEGSREERYCGRMLMNFNPELF